MTTKLNAIPQPVMQHRWRARIPVKGWADIISQQVVSVHVNYVKNELVLNIEQNANSVELHEFIYNIAKSALLTPISIEAMDGNENVFHAVQYNCAIKDHQFDLDYSKADVARHIVIFEIKELIPRELKA